MLEYTYLFHACVQTVPKLAAVRKTIVFPSKEWIDQSPPTSEIILLTMQNPNGFTRSLTIKKDCSWEVACGGERLEHSRCKLLQSIPSIIGCAAVNQLLQILHTSSVCAGHPDSEFVQLVAARKGKKITSPDGSTAAYLDENPVMMNGRQYERTIRSGKCEILSVKSKCPACVSYRDKLRVLHHRQLAKSKCSPSRHTSTTSHTNMRFMSTPMRLRRYRN